MLRIISLLYSKDSNILHSDCRPEFINR